MKITRLSFKLKVTESLPYGNMHSSTKILKRWWKFNKTANAMRLISLEVVPFIRFQKWYKTHFRTFICTAFQIYLHKEDIIEALGTLKYSEALESFIFIFWLFDKAKKSILGNIPSYNANSSVLSKFALERKLKWHVELFWYYMSYMVFLKFQSQWTKRSAENNAFIWDKMLLRHEPDVSFTFILNNDLTNVLIFGFNKKVSYLLRNKETRWLVCQLSHPL